MGTLRVRNIEQSIADEKAKLTKLEAEAAGYRNQLGLLV